MPPPRLPSVAGHFDVVVSVEQCVDCDNHAAHLRHDCRRYCSVADRALFSLVAAVSQAGLPVRLFGFKIPPSSAPRIGALEVTVSVALQGRWHSRLVFSKLNSGTWPNAARVAKDGLNFVTSLLLLSSESQAADALTAQSLDDVWPWIARLGGCSASAPGASSVAAAAYRAAEECVSEGLQRALSVRPPEGRAPAVLKQRVGSFLEPLEGTSGGVDKEEEELALMRHFCVFDRTFPLET